MSPSEWLSVISDVASGIITRDWIKGGAEAFSVVQMEKRKCGYIFWRRGSNGEKEMLRHFLENGVHIGDRELSSGDWGSNWRSGFIMLAKRDAEAFSGVQMQRSEDRLRRENFRGSRKAKEKEELRIPRGCVVFRPWLSLCYHLFWYPGRRFSSLFLRRC
jgi:hypothetical protein